MQALTSTSGRPCAEQARGVPRRALAARMASLFAAVLLTGCASLTFPISGVPVDRIPPELLGEPKEDKQTIDLALLGQEPPDAYRLGPGDVLGVWIEGVLGEPGQAPPVHYSEKGDLAPALGFPIAVREDGTIPLPLIKPIHAAGFTLEEMEEAVRRAYTVDTRILQPGEERVIVTIIRPRQYHVLVIRQDGGGPVATGGRGPIGGVSISTSKRGTGHAINLDAYKNDVLNALAETGGMPGLDAKNEIVIERGGYRPKKAGEPVAEAEDVVGDERGGTARARARKKIRIPLRLPAGEEPDIRPEDVLLQSGDIVYIESRDTEVFYTGGLLPTGEFALPRDYDLDVLEAVAQVQGPLVSGGVLTSQLSLSNQVLGGGIGGPSPSLVVILRRTKDGGQIPIRVDLNEAIRDPHERVLIQPGDVILLQQTPGEAVSRYVSGAVRFVGTFRLFNRRDAQGTATVTVP